MLFHKTAFIIIFLITQTTWANTSASSNIEFSDQNTVALWLFDDSEYFYSVLTDASQNESDLRIMDSAQLVSGVYGTALQTNTRSRAKKHYNVSYDGFIGSISNEQMREADGIPSGHWGPTEEPRKLLQAFTNGFWTLETYIEILNSQTEGTLIDLGDALLPGFTLSTASDLNSLIVQNHYRGTQYKFSAPNLLTPNTWFHLAITEENGSSQLYISGRKIATAQAETIETQPLPPNSTPVSRQKEHRNFTKKMSEDWRREHRFNISLGENRNRQNWLTAKIDEMRFSNVVRYQDDFTAPQSYSRNYHRQSRLPALENPSRGLPLLFKNSKDHRVLPLHSRKHLFIDMAFIESRDRPIDIYVNSLNNPEPLTVEANGHTVPFAPLAGRWRESLIDHNNQVHMLVSDGYSAEKGDSWLYSSEDGLHFKKLRTVFSGRPMGSTLIEDTNPHTPANERFKINSWLAGRGIYTYVSPDLVNWRRNEVAMLPLAVGSDPEVFWDDQQNLYFNHMKRDASIPTKQSKVRGRAGIMFSATDALTPWPFTKLEKPYFESWSMPSISDEGLTALGPRQVLPGLSEEVYRTRAIKYPWAPDTYIAFPYRSFLKGSTQYRRTEFAASRDGFRWRDYPFKKYNWFIPPNTTVEGKPTLNSIVLYGLIRREDELWLYSEFDSDGAPNGQDGAKMYYRLRMPIDRFAALSSTQKAIATTRAFQFEGKELELNLDTRMGEIRIGLLDENDDPIAGFRIDDFDSVQNTDTIHHVAKWKGLSDLHRLAGRTIKMQIQLNKAKLYALQFK